MKISINWVFDHIDADWRTIPIEDLVNRFNETTAEIETFYKVAIPLERITCARVTSVSNVVAVEIPEWKAQAALNHRPDALVDAWYFVIKHDDSIAWLNGAQFDSIKDGALPALNNQNGMLETGAWKKNCADYDYILEIDNKSITNRPDLWGHRGIAREFAAMFDLRLVPLSRFISPATVLHEKKSLKPGAGHPIEMRLESPKASRLATQFIDEIEFLPSDPHMALRLVRVDTRAIDLIVDATNYTMLDIGHPMHAFDAQTIRGDVMMVRTARNKEKVQLLGGTEVELTDHDLVIADADGAISLAGIKGGATSGVTKQTQQLLLEAACFDATMIRKTAARLKLRTEASARFEKTLDPEQPRITLERFVHLLKTHDVAFNTMGIIVSLGDDYVPHTISVSHAYIESQLGTTLAPKFIERVLDDLGFALHTAHGTYHITVPSYRATKDIRIKEDIVEEIARFFGYTNIPAVLPAMRRPAQTMRLLHRKRMIKRALVFGSQMHELASYPFFDEAFLQRIGWQPDNTIEVQNPTSANWRRLVTSLMPNLLHAVEQNCADYAVLRFFEWGRIWHADIPGLEKDALTGIFFNKKEPVDFYWGKTQLTHLFNALQITVEWRRVDAPQEAWFVPYQTAQLVHDDVVIGIAGKVNHALLGLISEGDAFAFEFTAHEFLREAMQPLAHFHPLPKYPAIERDISILVPLSQTVAHMQSVIRAVDPHIKDVTLRDFFSKKEWHDQKSFTFSIVLRDDEGTMTSEQADAIMHTMVERLAKEGAVIR